MTQKIDEKDLKCFAIDNDTAVISVLNHQYVMDYSTLMDLLTDLARVAAQVENDSGVTSAQRH